MTSLQKKLEPKFLFFMSIKATFQATTLQKYKTVGARLFAKTV